MSKKRRGNGEGTIFKRDGKWKGSITLGRDASGKLVRKWKTADTRRELIEKLEELKAGRRDGYLPASEVVTVEDVVRRYLKAKAGNLEPNTMAGYTSKAETYVLPALGHLPVEKLNAEHVDTMLDEMLGKGLDASTRKKALGVLSRSLKMAVKKRQLMYNVCDRVETPKVKPKEKITLTAEQLQSYFKALAGERMSAYFILLAQTGLRVSEALGLQWDCVNFETGEIIIRRALVDAGSKYYLKEYGKTASSSRKVKLTAIAEQELLEHRARMETEGNASSKWVFCNAAGDHLKRRAVLQWHKRILKNAGLPVIPQKNLRHTVATILLGRKWPLKTVADLLGHSNIQTTANSYAQFTEGIHREAIADLQFATSTEIE
ncbi:MAG: site-specific integrase [Planctomycetaceae bacterium]|nr:site-specific integrase [Planctomycetaceae bacterium]